MKKTDKPIIVEEVFRSPTKDLWRAITDPDQMKIWFFGNITDFQHEVGFETSFIVENDGRVFPHVWKILEVVPFKKITYNWKYEGFPGDSKLCFEIFEEDDGTKLRLTHDVTEDFPGDIPEFTRESCLGGWNYFIKESLKGHMERYHL
jgi:uncharacterized protein YndB with AHSA1/START domain